MEQQETSPVSAERPAPPGPSVEAPELEADAATEPEVTDGEGVSRQAGLLEPPD